MKGKSSDVFVPLGEPDVADVGHSLGQFVTLAENQICIDDFTGTDVTQTHSRWRLKMEKTYQTAKMK